MIRYFAKCPPTKNLIALSQNHSMMISVRGKAELFNGTPRPLSDHGSALQPDWEGKKMKEKKIVLALGG